ncbi:MAG: secretin N-terminal domain-containing protein [Candidatus Babeliales bacterium]|nr:secretin N-terminal domain-containing protein [Candidatus Babeliales bacterium]
MARNKNLLIITCFLIFKIFGDEPKVELNFESASLENVLSYIEESFNIKLLPDDAIVTDKKIKGVKDVKITFKSNRPFNKTQVLEFLDLLLEVSELARIPAPGVPDLFRITNVANSNKAYLPTFISKEIDELPNEGRIRYLYFSKNRPINQLKDIIQKLQSKNAQVNIFPDSNALIIVDEAYNVKSLLKIIKELDTLDSPEILTIIKLKNSDVNDIIKIYDSLKGKNETHNPFVDTKGTNLAQEVKAIADNRTNSLILFGPKNEVRKIEKFITEHIDIELNVTSKNIHFYKLNYASAEQVAKIMNSVSQYGAATQTGQAQGVKSGEQFINNLYFEADKSGNNLIIKGPLKEYNLIKNTIEQLDAPQPQVALEVYIVTVDLTESKSIQSQIRNKNLGQLNYQFVNSNTVVSPTGSLVANLISLATNSTVYPAGSTLISLGKVDVWALIGILQKEVSTNVISNPFLVTANGTPAKLTFGTQRRVTTSNIVTTGQTTQNSFGTAEANISVSVTPQINASGFISLTIDIRIESFTSTDPSSPDMNKSQISSKIKVADGESVALAGLTMNTRTYSKIGIPILENIPILGHLFSSTYSDLEKSNVMVFVSPKIINNTFSKNPMNSFTKNKTNDINQLIDESQSYLNVRDPINKWFFNEPDNELKNMFNDFVKIDNKEINKKNKPVKKSKLMASVGG